MAIIVEHEKRRKEILQKSLDVFVEEGYEDVTFQKIADRCGITRTTLYIYFHNKYDIFIESIKELLGSMELDIKKWLNKDISQEEILRQVVEIIFTKIEQNKKLFVVLLSYFMQLKKTGVDIEERIQRRVLRLRHILSTIIIHGIKEGTFQHLIVKDMNDLLYGLIESAIFRLVILNQEDLSDLRKTINVAIDGFVVNKNPEKE
ncbi:MAG: TetR/AcrR family transcriptional regulator [Treponema sp.]|nr:TetR/AcrR family transcriptional regulator [Treponema sp.]